MDKGKRQALQPKPSPYIRPSFPSLPHTKPSPSHFLSSQPKANKRQASQTNKASHLTKPKPSKTFRAKPTNQAIASPQAKQSSAPSSHPQEAQRRRKEAREKGKPKSGDAAGDSIELHRPLKAMPRPTGGRPPPLPASPSRPQPATTSATNPKPTKPNPSDPSPAGSYPKWDEGHTGTEEAAGGDGIDYEDQGEIGSLFGKWDE